MSSPTLSPTQAHALFDILTHHETYAEIEQFKSPEAIKGYGPPFQSNGRSSTSPVLQGLLSKFILNLPGARDLSQEFWRRKIQVIVEQLGEAELSESYDKGSIGARKTLATAISTLLEYLARGYLGGCPKQADQNTDRKYDTFKPGDVMRAWNDFVQQCVHGDMIDKLTKRLSETDKLEDHSPLVQAAHEHVLVNLASFLYYIIVLSPDGQYLVRVMDNLHKLMPYGLIRQTLKMGNAATMTSAMVKLLLAKISINAVTSWVGITKPSDEGQNTLQQIISTVLGWDVNDFQKRSAKIEKDKDGPSKEYLECIKAYVLRSRNEHDRCRQRSKMEGKSIVAIIFESASLKVPTNEAQHAQCLEYLSIHLSIRDREMLRKIICQGNPDLVTQAIRDCVAAYEPIIRATHNAVDLSATIWDFEQFMNDLIKISKIPAQGRWHFRKGTGSSQSSQERQAPTVEDYVRLLRKHQGASHRFLHSISNNGPEMAGWYRDYAYQATAQFRKPSATDAAYSEASTQAAGAMTEALNSLTSSLSDSDRSTVLPILDAHSAYLDTLAKSSTARMQSILSSKDGTTYGPGMYLARWQALLDATPITPATAKGKLRRGGSRSVRENSRTGVNGEKEGVDVEKVKKGSKEEAPAAPDVAEVVKLCGPGFREILRGNEGRV